MGQKQSGRPKSVDVVSRPSRDMPKAYQDSYRLLSTLVEERIKRHLLASLKEGDAQIMADFLNRILETETSQQHSERVNVLHTLSLLSRSALVFPECLKISGVECTFDPKQVHRSQYGDVYKGNSGGQVVRVKVILGDTTGYNYGQLLKMNAKEAILSAHMKHPNILPFYGVCDLSTDDTQRVCLVSAWMHCGNLLQYLENTPNPPRYRIMSGIISGLAYMHGLDIIHSDLQAKNVLVSNDGRALLADFGASRLSIATQTGTSAGTEYWTSPELFLGDVSDATQQCDIWSYACTCYEIITGIQPFSQYIGRIPSLISAFTDHRAVPTHSALTAENVDRRVLKALESCWDYKPSKRPSATDICKVFESLQDPDKYNHHDIVNSRVTSDNTEVNYDSVLAILQRVEKDPGPSRKKAPRKR